MKYELALSYASSLDIHMPSMAKYIKKSNNELNNLFNFYSFKLFYRRFEN